jgi:hypothetical protein
MSVDDSPSSWQLLLAQAQSRASSASPVSPGTGTLRGVPGGVSESSAQVVSQLTPSVRATVCDDVYLVCVRDGPGVDICGGRIGTNHARFCAKPCEPGKMACQFVSHATKVGIKAQRLFANRVCWSPKGDFLTSL